MNQDNQDRLNVLKQKDPATLTPEEKQELERLQRGDQNAPQKVQGTAVDQEKA